MMNDQEKRPREWWVILALLGLFLTALPALFSYPAEQILFNPDAYKQALAEQDVYSRFPLLMGEAMAEGGDAILPQAGTLLFEQLQQTSYEDTMRQVFPETWVREQSESLIDQFWDYFNFHSDQLRLVIDLRPVKDNLAGQGSAQVAATVLNGLRDCTQEDLIAFAQSAFTGQMDALPFCKPPQQLTGIATALIQASLQGTAAVMPEQVDLTSPARLTAQVASPFGGQRVEAAWERGFAVYRFFRQIGPWLPLVSLIFLLLTAWLAFRTYRGPLYWVGLGLLLPGFAGLIIALLLSLSSSQLIPTLLENFLTRGLVLFDLLADTAEHVSRRFITTIALLSFAVAAVGGLLMSGSVWLQKRKERTQAPL